MSGTDGSNPSSSGGESDKPKREQNRVAIDERLHAQDCATCVGISVMPRKIAQAPRTTGRFGISWGSCRDMRSMQILSSNLAHR